mmetsp:Transcript_32464/g.47377  ORF Transcript_32464/g.47377 Transcript_32464/m.47377 type:complete len:232 (-) Transcript_32464:939-1634(-)
MRAATDLLPISERRFCGDWLLHLLALAHSSLETGVAHALFGVSCAHMLIAGLLQGTGSCKVPHLISGGAFSFALEQANLLRKLLGTSTGDAGVMALVRCVGRAKRRSWLMRSSKRGDVCTSAFSRRICAALPPAVAASSSCCVGNAAPPPAPSCTATVPCAAAACARAQMGGTGKGEERRGSLLLSPHASSLIDSDGLIDSCIPCSETPRSHRLGVDSDSFLFEGDAWPAP